MMNMTKKSYAEKVANVVKASYPNAEVEVKEITKTNGVIYTGILIRENGSNIAPNLYVDEYFYDEVDVEEAAEQVIKLYEENKVPSFDIDWIYNYEEVKGKLYACLYNKSNSEQYPINVSAENYGYKDLIITARILVGLNDDKGSIAVSKELFDKWGVTVEEVIKDAMNNTSYSITGMSKIMIELMGEDLANAMGIFAVDDEDEESFVVTNKSKTNGAIGVILGREELINKFPNGYTVIPSSVHECIVIPITTKSKGELNGIVNEVNSSQVAAEEVLSNHVYVIK